MSKWLQDALSAVERIATGDPDTKEMKADLESLHAQLTSDEADAAEVKQVLQAVLDKLAASTPPEDTGSPQDNA